MAVANFTRLRLMELPILTLTPVRLAALAAAAAVGSTCGENITPPDNGDGDVVPASVSITGGAEVNIAGTLQLSATAKDASGVTITVVIMWASSDSAIATVDNTGKVTGVARGTVTIEASATGAAGAVTDTHDVTVRIASVAVSPATVTITSLGDTARLTAEAKDELGGTVPGVTFTFASSDTTVATVDDQGNVVAVGNGTGTVTVSGDTRSAEASITVAQQAARVSVTPAAVTMDALELDTALAATVADARGNTIAAASVSWTSSDPTVAAVDAASGLVTSKANGTAQIVAASGSAADTADVTVQQVIVGFAVLPDSVTATAFGDTISFTAAAVDRNNQPVSTAAASWSSTDPAVATVDQSGKAIAVGNGATYIKAVAGTGLDSAILVVNQLASQVSVSPASRTFSSLGDTATFTAAATDANGNAVTGKTTAWASSASSVASVDQNGLVAAVGNGSAEITAALDGTTGSASVTVSQVATSLSVSPTLDTMVSIGDTRDFTATATDANGNAVTVGFAWSSTNTAVASVSGTGNVGRATATDNGTTTIQVSRDGLSADAVLVVKQEVASVVVTPSSASVVETFTEQLAASPQDANGNPVAGASVIWSTNDTTVATVDATGLVTAENAGSATITATSDGPAGTASITVVAASLTNHVQPIFSARCALSGCHTGSSPPEGMNLSDGQAFANTVNVPSNQSPLLRIKPLEPDSSYLVYKILGTQSTVGGSGQRMPARNCCLTQAQIDTITAWVKKGAKNN